jgi:hypothetical protein
MAVILGMVSCADEEIPWEVDQETEMLVVEGSFTNESKRHRIILSKTADYFLGEKTPRVTGADVRILSKAATIEFKEVHDKPGVYENTQRIPGIAGMDYTLDISLDEPINNRTHYQAREKMIEGIKLERFEAYLYENPLYVERSPLDSVILLTYLYGSEPRRPNNLYMVNLYRNGELLQDTIDEAEIYSDREQLDGEYVNSLFFFETFNPGDTATIEVFSVSKSFQQFLRGIDDIANQSGNPFNLSGPPANAIGNIEDGKALGYFRVSYVSRASAIVQDRRKE